MMGSNVGTTLVEHVVEMLDHTTELKKHISHIHMVSE